MHKSAAYANANLAILVATHKPYWMPEDSCYLPVLVGAADRELAAESAANHYVRDDSGESISQKNANYCELTGLYWAWKNLDSKHLCHAQYVGLAHYRRHFSTGFALGDKKQRVASAQDVLAALGSADVLLPKLRNYFIETNWSQYVHAHHEQDLQLTRDIVGEFNPGLLRTFDTVMARTYGHRFNMFVMHREFMREWCAWLFPILFELENRLDISDYSQNDARVFGFVAERLMDVWVEGGGLSVAEMPVVNLENQHWLRKGAAFLGRKVAG